jgi:putative Mg2+ transporter-C (MgtC) family protein
MTPAEALLRLLLAAVFGAALGVEREYRRKPAGLRTNILIALGSSLFTIVAINLSRLGGTPDRIVAQVVTGIGFVGGGAILRSRTSVHGMTTAATVWVNAAIGVATGTGDFKVAAAATALTLIVLAVLPPIEDYFERRASTAPDRHQQRHG